MFKGDLLVNVDIDEELYSSIKRQIDKKRFVYPSIKFFVQSAIYKELRILESSEERR